MILKSLFRRFSSNVFVQNIAVVTGGNVMAKLIGFMSAPIITRLYTPAEYGVFSVFTSIIAIIGSVATLRYAVAIPLPSKEKDSDYLLKLSFLISFLLAFLFGLIIFIGGDYIINILSLDVIIPYLWLIPFAIIGKGLYNGLTNWAVRQRQFRLITKTKVVQGSSSAGIKVGLGFLGLAPDGLIFGALAQEFAGIFSLVSKLIKGNANFFREFNVKYVFWIAKRYRKFPLIQTWSQFLLSLGAELPVLLISSFFGASEVGIYGLSHTIINMPINLLGQSVSQVYYGEISKIGKHNPRKIYELSLSIIKKMFWLGLIPVSIIIIFGPYLFSLVFGEEWQDAGVYSRYLSILILTRFISSPIGNIFNVFERQGLQLTFNIVRIALVFLVFGVSNLMNISLLTTIGVYSLSMTIYYGFLSILIFNVVRKSF